MSNKLRECVNKLHSNKEVGDLLPEYLKQSMTFMMDIQGQIDDGILHVLRGGHRRYHPYIAMAKGNDHFFE